MSKIGIGTIFLMIFFAFGITTSLYSQNEDVKFSYYSVEHGLPESAVFSIYQDSRGYMWFGTMNGLCRFDGYNFVTGITDRIDAVSSMYEDKFGFMWIGTNRGLLQLDKTTNKIIRHCAASSNDSLYDNEIIKIIEDKYNNLWIATQSGINVYNREKNNFFKIKTNTRAGNIIGKGIKTLFYDNNGNLWIGSEGGGISIITSDKIRPITNADDADRIHIYNFKQKNNNNLKLNSWDIAAIQEDKNGIIWIGTMYDGLNYLKKTDLLKIISNPNTRVKVNSIKARFFSKDGLESNKINCLYEDKLRNLWIGTYGGGLHLYLGDGKFKKYMSNEYVKGSLSNDFIHAIYEDNSGILWIGTSGGGVNRCNINKIAFKVFKRSYSGFENGLYENMVFSLLEDRNKDLWIGTRNGLSFYNSKTKKFFHYSNNPKYLPGIRNDMTRTLCEDSSGNIWIGTVKYGLIERDKKSGAFTSFTNSPGNSNTISTNNVRSLLMDGSEHLWIGTVAGLDVLNLRNHHMIHYFGANNQSSLSSSYVYFLYKDQWNHIWVCTKDGLSLYNRNANNFSRFYYKTTSFIKEVTSVTADDDGVIWFGTTRNGIYKLTPSSYNNNGEPVYNSSSKIEKLTAEPAITEEFIYFVKKDDLGKIWFGTNHGLWRLNPKNNYLKRYDVNDGLQSNEFNTNATFKSPSGVLYFGGVNGFNSCHPIEINDAPIIPYVAITSFKIYDKDIKFESGIENQKEINLTYEDKYFSFEFAVLDFTDPDNNCFAYKLEGFDKDWIYCNNRRFASYTNLGGGDYIFRVKGANKDNVWNETGKSIIIHIKPPLYKTLWFQITILLILIFILIMIIRMRTKQLDQLNKKLELMVRQRTEEIKRGEDRYRNFVSQTTEGIWRCELTDPISTKLPVEEQIRIFVAEAYIAECNDVLAKMFEYNSTDEMVGKKLKDIFISDIRENFVFINTFFNSNYKLVEGKTTVNPKEGSTRYISHNLVGIVENSFLVRAWGTSTNITEKLKLEEEIMKSQKLESLGILAGGLAHDFNNLLTGILGNISLAKMYSTPDEKLFKRLTEAEKASFRAKDLTFQLMTFSKGGAPIKKTIDLKKTLRETTEFTLSGSKSKALIDISEDLWTVDCDEGQISQVISNLVINADQAMPDGGIINIKAQNVDFKDDSGNLIINQGRYVYISVEDNGDGIKSENLSKIFDPFFTTKPKGKGLGLTSVYSIIKRHNGYIDVDSETGTGTIFNIYLPASSGRQDIPIESTSDLKKGYGKILLMDDEEMIRDLGLNLLAEMGYEVDTSNDGLEAINKYKESLLNEKYRAVILDLTVPGGVGGTEAAKQIFDMDKEAKILVSSGYSNDPVMSNYRAYGFSGIIPKPYRTEELNSILDNVLNYSNH